MHEATGFQTMTRQLARLSIVLAAAAVLSACGGESEEGTAAAASPPPVVAPAPTPSPTTPNQPPEISGVPAAVIDAGQDYSFVPTAKDADNDFLEFSITNKPTWAQFSVETGALTGSPQDADVGETADITINVT